MQSNQTLDAATKQRIVRAEGAQQNGFENVGLFASAVVAANSKSDFFAGDSRSLQERNTRADPILQSVAKVDNWTLNVLSGSYLVSRAVYNIIYINNESEGLAGARTATFLGGVGVIFTLFVKAGNALRDHL